MDNSLKLVVKDDIIKGNAIVYVMSRDQRTRDNFALLAAQKIAIEQNQALYVLFVLKNFAGRSREHYQFMLDGLKIVASELAKFNIPFGIKSGEPEQEILNFCSEVNASGIFFDFSPLSGPRSLVKNVAKNFNGSVTVVDTHNIIPAWVVSDKQEYAAHTMRTKIHHKLDQFLVTPPKLKIQTKIIKEINSLSFEEAERYIKNIPACGINIKIPAGELAAQKHLDNFINFSLQNYANGRNDIATDQQSGLSPYLHFGQISSLRVALDIIDSVNGPSLLLQKPRLAENSTNLSRADGMNALLEEMIVRKELADNFCFYTKSYKDLESIPNWAKTTLAEHTKDSRDYIYDVFEWEHAQTHDLIWNASQTELAKTGKIHGYMRMYWAKKILEWSPNPEEALKTAIYLNDKYSIDGGDPNGYVGILWSIAGLHDRPWLERSVFGKIRYMNDAGLRRKFDVDVYIKRVNLA